MTDEFEEKISRLYKKIPHEQPSHILDARIKKLARKHVPDRPAYRKSHQWQWLSAVAVMVLSVGVVLNVVRYEMPETVTESVVQQPADKVIAQPEAARRAPALSSPPAAKRMHELQPLMQSDEIQMDLAEKTFIRDKQQNMAESELKSEVAGSVPQWCGQTDLADISDKTVWLQRIEQLRAQGDEQVADCLELLMKSVFVSP